MSTVEAEVDQVQVEMERIAALHDGLLPAEAVVDAARSPTSPLHDRFEWDDSVAAHAHRLTQARRLIASVTITPTENRTVRAWVSLQSDRDSESPVYRPMVKVLSDDDMRGQMLSMAKNELGRLRTKYAQLTELANVWDAISAVQA